MDIVGERLRGLRKARKLSQKDIGEKLGVGQSSVNRYESNTAELPYASLVKLADYYQVSLDYIFGRMDEPTGALYPYQPPVDAEQWGDFVEACFDPTSPLNARLKETLIRMMEEVPQ